MIESGTALYTNENPLVVRHIKFPILVNKVEVTFEFWDFRFGNIKFVALGIHNIGPQYIA